MSRPEPQYPHHHHHRQAYDGDDDNGPVLTSPVRIRPVPANRPPALPRVPDRSVQIGLDAESHEQPRRTERPLRPPVGTTRRPTARTPAAAPSRSDPRTSDPSRAPPPRLQERSPQRGWDEADRGHLYALPGRLHERPIPRPREDVDGRRPSATRGRPDECHPRREESEPGKFPAYPPPEPYPQRFDERPPTRRKGEFDQGWLSPRLEQLRERHVPSRQDIFGIDHAPPPPSRLHDRPIYKPREVVVYDDDPVSPPPKPLLARHGREHNSLPERPPQPPRAPPPPRPPQAPQPPQASPPPPPPPPPPVPPATNLDPTVLKLLTTLHSALSHTHYAITGPLALTAWGFPPSPTHSDTITILCPADDRAVIRAWAAAAGFGIGTSPSHRHHNPDEMTVDISLPRHHHNDRDRPTTRFTVVLHPLPPAKWAIAARESAVLRGGVQIAGLLGLVDWFAGAFSGALAAGDGRGVGETGRAVLWLLERAVKGRGGRVIGAEEVPRVVEGGFGGGWWGCLGRRRRMCWGGVG